MNDDVKKQMEKMQITQVDLILELQRRGFEVQPPAMSSILRGVYTYPKAKTILRECKKILDEWESNFI